MAQHKVLTHGPRRALLRPWRKVCRCGLGAYPCPAERMLEKQRQALQPSRSAPGWAEPTRQLPITRPTAHLGNQPPLLTPGQAYRTRGNGGR